MTGEHRERVQQNPTGFCVRSSQSELIPQNSRGFNVSGERMQTAGTKYRGYLA